MLNKKELQTKRDTLKRIGEELKKEFFGIDNCIDRIIESIKTWYLLPEAITRPVIVSLWGLTGVGKTAVVRSLVNKLKYEQQFVEIQMDGISTGSSSRSICEMLEASAIEQGQSGIILLDEFQRFRTIDDDGKEVKLERYQDVWMLLSDGKFSSDYSILTRIEEQLAYMEYTEDQADYRRKMEEIDEKYSSKNKDSDEPIEAEMVTDSDGNVRIQAKSPKAKKNITAENLKKDLKRKYTIYPYEARTIKKLLRLTEPITEIMTWNTSILMAKIREYKDDNKNSTINYNKCLIFIVGNVDEAFRMANGTEDCDTNADIFFEETRKIGVLEIKKALKKRFFPEQIARLGNNHIVYASLNAQAYRDIIKSECKRYTESTQKISKIQFTVDKQVYTEIYENSVYPAQGTRPVFSSIHKLFSSPLSDAVLWALENEVHHVYISLDIPTSSLVFKNKQKTKKFSVKVDFELRERKSSRSEDFKSMIAVHESGHALLHCHLFKNTPLEVVGNGIGFEGGYNQFSATSFSSKEELLDKMAVLMGGLSAEEIIFGKNMRSNGCASDIERATTIASQIVRILGMNGHMSAIRRNQSGSHATTNEAIDETNPQIDMLAQAQKERAIAFLTKNKALLVRLAKELREKRKMTAEELYDFLHPYMPELTKNRPNEDVNQPYALVLDNA